MSTTLPTSLASAVALTPSEQVLLDAEAHSSIDKDGTVPVLQTPGRYVDSGPIAEAMWAAALLANEGVGAVRLDLGIRKAWFGLAKTPEVQVHMAGATPAWPAGSLEESVVTRAKTRTGKGRHDARGLFDALIDRDFSPHAETAARAIKGLTGRGLSHEVEAEKTTLKVFKRTVRHPTLTPAGEAMLRAHPPEAAAQLLARCQRERPDVWAALIGAIRHTLNANTISNSDYSSSD